MTTSTKSVGWLGALVLLFASGVAVWEISTTGTISPTFAVIAVFAWLAILGRAFLARWSWNGEMILLSVLVAAGASWDFYSDGEVATSMLLAIAWCLLWWIYRSVARWRGRRGNDDGTAGGDEPRGQLGIGST